MYRPHPRAISQSNKQIPMSIHGSVPMLLIYLWMSLNPICPKSMILHHSFTHTWAILLSVYGTLTSHLKLHLFMVYLKGDLASPYYVIHLDPWHFSKDQPRLAMWQIGVNSVLSRSISLFSLSVLILLWHIYISTKATNNTYQLILIT
jgi:hypothetical protein